MRGHAPISGVYRLGEPTRRMDPLEEWGRMDMMRRNAWRQAGFVAVRPAELPEPLATELKRWAEAEYGGRPNE